MSRERVPKGQIFLKKEEKTEHVLSTLQEEFTEAQFIEAFIKLYNDDWNKIIKRFKDHERLSKGKSHPMPEPRAYLRNMLNSYLAKKKITATKKVIPRGNHNGHTISEVIYPDGARFFVIDEDESCTYESFEEAISVIDEMQYKSTSSMMQ